MCACIQQGTVQLREAVQVRSSYAFVSALKACLSRGYGDRLPDAKILHSHIVSSGLEMDPYVANTLTDVYAKLSSLDDALAVFRGLPSPDLVSWNTIIAGFAQNGCGRCSLRLFDQMQQMQTTMPNRITYVCALKACSSIGGSGEGMLVHAQIVEDSAEANLSVGNSLVDMYAKCGSLDDSLRVFDGLPQRDAVTWSTIMSALCNRGRGCESLAFFHRMLRDGRCAPNHATYFCALKACSSLAMLDRGILIHAQIVEDGLQLDASVANALIDMYSKCGNFGDAFKILEDLPARNVVSWTAIVANLSYQGFGQEAFRTFHEMQSEGVKPNEITYAGILRACAGAKAVGEGRLIHAHMVEQMIERDLACGSVVGNSLLDMYAKCRSLDDARNVFYCCLAEHDAASYSVMISMYAQHGSANGALQLFREMQSVGIRPNEATYVSILKLGSDVADLGHALSMHSQIIKHGFDADTWVCNSLLNMYIKCGSIDHAQQLFDLSGWHDVVAWSVLIAGYAEHGHVVEAFALFERMQASGVEPNPITLIAILKACSASLALNRGKSVHEYAVRYGHESDICVANALVHLYTACRQLQDGMLIFESLPERDVVTWTVIIAAHIQHDRFEGALLLLSRMQQQGIEPNHATFISAFKSCCSPSAARLGKRLHSWVIEDGLDSDAPIANSVIHMYGNCGAVADSLAAFYVLRRRDVIAWSTMIALLSEQGECAEALRFYRDMLDDEGLEPNHITLLSVVRSCSGVERLEQGQIVHSQIAEAGLIQAEVAIGNALIDMYAKCGALGDARKVFGGMARRDVVSWTAVIEGHAQQRCSRDALVYFGQMLQLGIAPNSVTLLSVLGACCSIAAMQQGRVIHGHVIEQGFEHDPRLASALLDLYAKCSTCGDARNLFAGLKDQDAVAWSSMVAGHAQANDFGSAMEYFDGMLKHGLQPDDVAFLSLLSACSHVGLLSEGLRIIGLMIGDGLELSSEHYSCIVDLLGRTGQLDAARAMVETLPSQLGAIGFTSLLGHSLTHGDSSLGTRCFNTMLD